MNKSYEKLDLTQLPQAVVEHIKQLERIRSDFVANVSHELRTPLTVIKGYLEALMEKPEADNFYRKIFTQMWQHSVRMENIIDELLLLSRLESEDSPQEEKQSVDVASMLNALFIDAKRISGDKKHKITLRANKFLQLYGSENELKSLFSNIIINAVKYTPTRGNIAICWEENNGAIFSVRDTGIGIAPEHIPRLTERFYRVDQARSRQSGGTGLGLAIAKHVLMRHEGELKIESQLGKGSRFICYFPLHRLQFN